MALTTQTMERDAPEEEPTGEVRVNSEGKGFWYSYAKHKKVEEIKTEVVKKTKPLRGKK
jgi:hypothetical protein